MSVTKKRGFGSATKPAVVSSATERFGLDELETKIIDEAKNDGSIKRVKKIDISPDPHQPRKVFDPARHAEMCQSIAAAGILQPLLVRERLDGEPGYLIIAGERRWRAAMEVESIDDILVVVRNDLDPGQILVAQLIENIQRESMTPLDTAQAFERVMKEQGINQRQLGESLGMSESNVSVFMSLLKAPQSVQKAAGQNGLQDATAMAKLARLSAVNPEKADEIAAEIISDRIKPTAVRAVVAQALKDSKKPKNAGKEEILPTGQPITRLVVTSFGWLSGSDEPLLKVTTPTGVFELEFPRDIETTIEALTLSAEERAG